MRAARPWVDGGATPVMQSLLSSWSLEGYLATLPPSPVVTLPADCTVGQALKRLADHNVTSAPVFEESSRTYLGFVDLDDVLGLLLQLVSVRELNEDDRVFRLRAAGLQLEQQPLSVLLPGQDGALIYRADLRSSLLDVITHGFLEPAGGDRTVVHRVGVFEEEPELEEGGGPSMEEDASLPAAAAAAAAAAGAATEPDDEDGGPSGIPGIRITHVISQSDILRWVLKRMDGLGWPLAGITLEALGFTCQPVMCVPQEMSTINALATMAANQVSCVGVVSHSQGGALAAQISSSVLRGLLPQHFSALAQPVIQFLSNMQAAASSCGPNPLQARNRAAAGPAQAAGLKGSEALKPLPVVRVERSATLKEAMQRMAAADAARVFIVDGQQRPVGIVTQTDVLRKLVGWRPGVFGSRGASLGDLRELEDVDRQVEQQPMDGDEDAAPDCGLEPGGELVEGAAGLRGVASAAVLAGWGVA